MTIIEQLKHLSEELTDLQHALALLQWDQEVLIPERAAEDRARQMATLSGVIHRKQVAPELGRLLDRAAGQEGLSVTERALVRVMRRHYDQSTKLPEDFVTRFSRLTSRALSVWTQARRHSDFALFAPLLADTVAMCRRKADYLGYPEEPYDALLDLHEEGLTTARVTEMFAGLKASLSDMVRRLRGAGGNELRFAEPFRQEEQVAFAERMLAAIGFDFERGRQDLSAHPFTTALGHHDHRVTNRYQPHSLEFIFSALHEGGHALYEQHIADSLAGTALDSGISLGVHESQSRLWENIIGRSRPFWEHFYPELQAAFPSQFADLPLPDFFDGLNLVRPGLIRVEADEVSYNMHVLIRFELERALIEGTLSVEDLPAAWNEKYRDYLDVRVEEDADGVLQDIHWSHGSFGYFPTYTIGNLASAQIWEAYREQDRQAEETVRRGDLAHIRSWLAERIYRHGSVFPPAELIEQATGKPLAAAPFLNYLGRKYSVGVVAA